MACAAAKGANSSLEKLPTHIKTKGAGVIYNVQRGLYFGETCEKPKG